MGGGEAQGGMMSGGGMQGMEDELLCGESDPTQQCRVACIRVVQCLTALCPYAPPNDYVGNCQGYCPDIPWVPYVCADDRSCESIVSRLTVDESTLTSDCYEGPCQLGDCGARGRCVDGRCECARGYTGSRCDTPPTPAQTEALCRAFIACAEACEDDQRCAALCQEEHEAGHHFFQAFSACNINSGCLTDGEFDQECALRECLEEVELCFGPQ